MIFVDADDYIHKDMLKTMVDIMKDTDADIVKCRYIAKYEGNKILYGINLAKQTQYTARQALDELNYGGKITASVCDTLFKRKVITDLEFPPEATIGEDYTFIVKVLINCRLIIAIPDALYIYTQNSKSVTHRGYTKNSYKNLNNYKDKSICKAIRRLAKENQDVKFIFPVYLNPQVQEIVHTYLSNVFNICLSAPIDVLDMHNLIARCYFVMTDSGGLQEESPAFGKPVLVLRTETERPEAIEANTAKLVGVNEDNIYNEAKRLLEDKNAYNQMSYAVNPYGDGHASERITGILLRKNKGSY